MNPNAASRRVMQSGYLNPTERCVLFALILRADNTTGQVTDKFAPRSVTELGEWTGLSKRQLQRVLRHLERHRWLHVIRGDGRGNRTLFTLLVAESNDTCDCTERVTPTSPFTTHRKGDTDDTLSSDKGRHPVPLSGAKGCQKRPIKGDIPEHETAGQDANSVRVSESKELRESGLLDDPPDPHRVVVDRLNLGYDIGRERAAELVTQLYARARKPILSPSEAYYRIAKRLDQERAATRWCSACGEPLDPQLAALGDRTHPTC